MTSHLCKGQMSCFLRIICVRWVASLKQLFPAGKHMYEPVHTYLQACALVRKRRAEETCDNAHDCLGYITLQHGICMLPVTCVVAHLRKDRDGNCMRQSYFMALPRYKFSFPHPTFFFFACPRQHRLIIDPGGWREKLYSWPGAVAEPRGVHGGHGHYRLILGHPSHLRKLYF